AGSGVMSFADYRSDGLQWGRRFSLGASDAAAPVPGGLVVNPDASLSIGRALIGDSSRGAAYAFDLPPFTRIHITGSGADSAEIIVGGDAIEVSLEAAGSGYDAAQRLANAILADPALVQAGISASATPGPD